MPEAAFNLQAQVVGTQVAFVWQLPVSIGTANAVFLDIATESGFVNYRVQHEVLPRNLTGWSTNLPVGFYWARVNIHYPGFGDPEFGPLDRGWFPSNSVFIQVGNPAALPSGIPARNIQYLRTPVPIGGICCYNLTWVPAVGLQGAQVTRVAVDISTFPQFDDILQSPFVTTDLGGGVDIDSLPFAVDVPLLYNKNIRLGGLPLGQQFYLRVNTLFNNLVWMPSTILKFRTDGTIEGEGGSQLWLLAAGALLVVGGLLYIGAGEDEEDKY